MKVFEKYTEEQKAEYIKRVTALYIEKSERIKNKAQLIKVLKAETISALDNAYAEKFVRLDAALKMLERA